MTKLELFFMCLTGLLFCQLANAEWAPPTSKILPKADPFPASISAAQWLWPNVPVRNNMTVYYRYTLNLGEPVKTAWLLTAMDDNGDLQVNGISQNPVNFKQPDCQVRFRRYEPQGFKIGKNILSFAIRNDGDLGGIILRGEITLKSGKIITISSSLKENWKASDKSEPGWRSVDFNDSAWTKARSLGDVRTFPWVVLSNVMNFMMSSSEKNAYQKRIDKINDISFLKNESQSKARIVWQNSMAGLEVNGRVEAPIIFLVENPWTPQVADMVIKCGKSGIKFLEYQVMATKAFQSPGNYDFSYIDNDINRILSLNHDALLFIALRIDMGAQWLHDNPDELIGYATGETDGKGGQMGRFCAPSMASEIFREEMKSCARAFVKHLKSRDYFKRIVALRASHGIYSEWHYYGMCSDMPDTGKAMTRGFRKFLKEKYYTNTALQQAWHNKQVTLSNATVPGKTERCGKNRFLRDPAGTDKQTLDYYKFHQDVVADTLLNFAKTVKEEAPNLLVGAYYGYLFCMGYPPEGQTLLLDKILGSQYIDFLSSPYSYYEEARFCGGDGQSRMLASIFRSYGKLAIFEDDTRTYLSYESFRKINDRKKSYAVIRRNIANAWLNGGAIQFLDFNAPRGRRCCFNDPEIFKIFHQGEAIWRDLYQKPHNSHAEVVAVISPVEMGRQGYPDDRQRTPIRNIIDNPVHGLRRSGSPVEILSLNDYLASKINYRLVIFLNIFSPSPEERSAILAKIRRPGVTAVWNYAPGLVTESGFSNDAMNKLTGIKLQVKYERLPMTVRLNDGSILEKYNWTEKPRVHSIDPKGETLGKYANDLADALVSKKLADGSVAIFAGMPIFRGDVWQGIFKRAGVHIYTEPGIIVSGNDQLLMVHVRRNGFYPVSLKKCPKTVHDLFSGRKIPVSGKELLLKSNKSQTWLILIKY